MTDHYMHAGNDHANATKGMKCIKLYTYNKSLLKSETTKIKRTT